MLSIIVPVYNAEKTLARTLDSIQGQLYKDWECILVNDGSKDSSIAVCNEYAAKDCRFKVIDKPNGGVSSARNKGLEMAQGELIVFCDADDILEPVMYEQLIKGMKENEAEVANCNYIHEDKFSCFSNKIEEFVVLDKPLNYIYSKEWHIGTLWNKVFRRNVLLKLTFNLNIKYSEDHLFIAQALEKCNRIAVTKGQYYHYLDYANSATKQMGSYQFWGGYVEAMKEILEIVKKNDCDQCCQSKAEMKYAVSIFSLLRLAIQNRDKKAYDKYLDEYRAVLNKFLSANNIKFDKKLSYWTYCQGYGLASLVHYYLRKH